ncbi:MAG: hypothetical protein U1E21_21035 [Reyranellaceae bacterium]
MANRPETGLRSQRHGKADQRRLCAAPVRGVASSLLAAAAAAAALPTPTRAASFDGVWSVIQDCPVSSDGARGYKWSYDAVVKDGALVGEHGTKGNPGSQTLTGSINADGSARLAASGLTGDSDRTKGYLQPGSKFYFTVEAKFAGTKGTGTRTAGRTCSFTFTRK